RVVRVTGRAPGTSHARLHAAPNRSTNPGGRHAHRRVVRDRGADAARRRITCLGSRRPDGDHSGAGGPFRAVGQASLTRGIRDLRSRRPGDGLQAYAGGRSARAPRRRDSGHGRDRRGRRGRGSRNPVTRPRGRTRGEGRHEEHENDVLRGEPGASLGGRVVREVRTGWGLVVVSVGAGGEAMELVEERTCGRVSAVLVMPGFLGLQLLVRVWRVFPTTPVLFLTGQGSIVSSVLAIKDGAYA